MAISKFTLVSLGALVATTLAGCGTTSISARMYHNYEAYKELPHYRAFVATGGGIRTAVISAWRHSAGSVNEAIESALETCQASQSTFQRVYPCKLQAIGDIEVVGMSETELARAIALYGSFSQATNSDLDAASRNGGQTAALSTPKKPDPQEEKARLAQEWTSICKAAHADNGTRRSFVGWHYRNGWAPVETNFVESYKWFTLAMIAGYTNAASYRKDLAASMSASEVEQAKRLTAQWKPDPGSCEGKLG